MLMSLSTWSESNNVNTYRRKAHVTRQLVTFIPFSYQKRTSSVVDSSNGVISNRNVNALQRCAFKWSEVKTWRSEDAFRRMYLVPLSMTPVLAVVLRQWFTVCISSDDREKEFFCRTRNYPTRHGAVGSVVSDAACAMHRFTLSR